MGPPLGLRPAGLPRDDLHRPPGDGHVHPFTEDRGDWRSGRAPGLKHWAYWYRKGGDGFDLHIPAYGRSVWQGPDSPPELLARVAQFEHATGGVEWKGEATITSDAFLRRRLRRTLRPTDHPPPVVSGEAHEVQEVWHRLAREDEHSYRWVHALDLNLAYATGASSIALPTGPYEHVDWPTFDPNVAGVYFVEDDDEARGRWVTAPTFQRLEALGFHAVEGYVWPESGRHLRPWYEMLRDGRAELLESGGDALLAVKAVCREGLGRMASKVRTVPDGKSIDDDPLYQPYWAWAVIAEVRERLLARVAGLPVARNGRRVQPVAIDVDCLYFLSNRESPAALAVGIGLPLGDGLGQFKPAGSCSGKVGRAALKLERSNDAVDSLREACKLSTKERAIQ